MKKFLPIILCSIFLMSCKTETQNLTNNQPESQNKTTNSVSDKQELLIENSNDCLTLTEFSQYWRNTDKPIEEITLCIYKKGKNVSLNIPHVFEDKERTNVLTKFCKEEKIYITPTIFIPKIHHETETHIFYELLPKERVHFLFPNSFFFEYNKIKKQNQLVATYSQANFETVHFDENILIGKVLIQGGDYIALYNRSLNNWYSLDIAGTAEFDCDSKTKTCFATNQDLYCRTDDTTICGYRWNPPRYKKEDYKLIEFDPNQTNFVSFGSGEKKQNPKWEKQFKHKYSIVMTLEDMIKTTQMETPVFHLGEERYFMQQINSGQYERKKME